MPGTTTQSTPQSTQDFSYVDGGAIMLYVEIGSDSDKKFVATAGAKSHKISYKATMKTRQTKDTENSLYEQKDVKTIAVTISVDGLVAVGDNRIGSKELLQMLKKGTKVKVRYGAKADALKGSYEEGLFLIESWEESSPAGDDATYSAQLVNSGAVQTVVV